MSQTHDEWLHFQRRDVILGVDLLQTERRWGLAVSARVFSMKKVLQRRLASAAKQRVK